MDRRYIRQCMRGQAGDDRACCMIACCGTVVTSLYTTGTEKTQEIQDSNSTRSG
jgi:hypothetical protein